METNQAGPGRALRVTHAKTEGSLASAAADEPHGSILVVDDERMVGAVLARVLCGYEVSVVTDARDALVMLSEGKRFDLIFSDLMMPEMSGMDFFGELARRHPSSAERVVFISGGVTPSTEAFLDGVPNPRLGKPFDVETVRELARTYTLRGRDAEGPSPPVATRRVNGD